jgi:hypothetical protein
MRQAREKCSEAVKDFVGIVIDFIEIPSYGCYPL